MSIDIPERTLLLERLDELRSAKRRLEELESAYRVVGRSKFAQLGSVLRDVRDLAQRTPRRPGQDRDAEFVTRALTLHSSGDPREKTRLYAELARLDAECAHLTDLLEAERSGDARKDAYGQWLERHAVRDGDIRRLRAISQMLPYRPTFSILMPTYDTSEGYLRDAIDSVIAQAYPNWELCIADDASPSPHVRAVLEEYAANDERIRVVFRSENGHISRATNSALELATGEFVALFDHDDLLTPDALFEMALALNADPSLDMIYSDEDKISDDRHRHDPYFKPDWAPDSFLSRMYTCHLGIYRTALAREIGGFRIGFEGSQDYDFVLRFTERTEAIAHIPHVLYNWRVHANSTALAAAAKPYATEAARRALEEAIERRGEPGTVLPSPDTAGVYIVRYDLQRRGKISIVVPTRDHGDDVDRCLGSIFKRPTYDDFEILLVDNGSTDRKSLAAFAAWERREPRVRVLPYDVPFNFSQINNYAVDCSESEYLVFLNNDTEVISLDWLEAMVEQMQRASIGAVGAMLLYPDDTVQHAGVVVGVGGVAGHSHKYFAGDEYGYFGMLKSINNYSAVTGACLGIRRAVFDEVGRFDESLAVAFNDVDLCLRIAAAGYRNVWLPHVRLHHFESKSRGAETTPEKQTRFAEEVKRMVDRWDTHRAVDPYYSPHLTREHENYSIRA